MEEQYIQLIEDLERVITKAKKAITDSHSLLLLYTVSDEYGITVKDIRSPRRDRPIADARVIYAHIMHARYNATIAHIAKKLSKHHSSVIAMLKRYKDFIDTDAGFSTHVDNVLNKIED